MMVNVKAATCECDGIRIARITDAFLRRYRDNGQVEARVHWIDELGHTGMTAGQYTTCKPEGCICHSYVHMDALLERAKREGVKVKHETW